VLNTVWW